MSKLFGPVVCLMAVASVVLSQTDRPAGNPEPATDPVYTDGEAVESGDRFEVFELKHARADDLVDLLELTVLGPNDVHSDSENRLILRIESGRDQRLSGLLRLLDKPGTPLVLSGDDRRAIETRIFLVKRVPVSEPFEKVVHHRSDDITIEMDADTNTLVASGPIPKLDQIRDELRALAPRVILIETRVFVFPDERNIDAVVNRAQENDLEILSVQRATLNEFGNRQLSAWSDHGSSGAGSIAVNAATGINTPTTSEFEPFQVVVRRMTRRIDEFQKQITDMAPNVIEVPLAALLQPVEIGSNSDFKEPVTPAEAAEPVSVSLDHIQVYVLRHAVARELAEILKKLGFSDSDVVIEAEPNTNRIIARGPERRLAGIGALIGELDQPFAVPPADGGDTSPDPDVHDDLQTQLRDAQSVVKRLAERYGPNHPSVRQQKQRIQVLQQAVANLSVRPARSIRNLQREYEHAEREAARLADIVRTEQRRETPRRNVVNESEESVKKWVRAAFDLRQKIQLARVAESRDQLNAVERRLKQRSVVRDLIVDRRLQELLAGEDLSWLPSSGQSRPESPATSVDQSTSMKGRVDVHTFGDQLTVTAESEEELNDFERFLDPASQGAKVSSDELSVERVDNMLIFKGKSADIAQVIQVIKEENSLRSRVSGSSLGSGLSGTEEGVGAASKRPGGDGTGAPAQALDRYERQRQALAAKLQLARNDYLKLRDANSALMTASDGSAVDEHAQRIRTFSETLAALEIEQADVEAIRAQLEDVRGNEINIQARVKALLGSRLEVPDDVTDDGAVLSLARASIKTTEALIERKRESLTNLLDEARQKQRAVEKERSKLAEIQAEIDRLSRSYDLVLRKILEIDLNGQSAQDPQPSRNARPGSGLTTFGTEPEELTPGNGPQGTSSDDDAQARLPKDLPPDEVVRHCLLALTGRDVRKYVSCLSDDEVRFQAGLYLQSLMTMEFFRQMGATSDPEGTLMMNRLGAIVASSLDKTPDGQLKNEAAGKVIGEVMPMFLQSIAQSDDDKAQPAMLMWANRTRCQSAAAALRNPRQFLYDVLPVMLEEQETTDAEQADDLAQIANMEFSVDQAEQHAVVTPVRPSTPDSESGGDESPDGGVNASLSGGPFDGNLPTQIELRRINGRWLIVNLFDFKELEDGFQLRATPATVPAGQ